MRINNEKIGKIIDSIASEEYSFGNKLLYDMCKDIDGQKWDDPKILADKIWLVGRSYAASPERRISKGDVPKVGDGTGEYFNEVAKDIHNNFIVQNEIINKLNGNYKFDFSDSDIALLIRTIKSVEKFNDAVKEANIKYDEYRVEESNYKNQISFCSKFLHFHFPNTFFIFDSFSKTATSYLFPKRTPLNKKVIKIQDEYVAISKDEIEELLKECAESITVSKFESDLYNQEAFLGPIKEYANHCVRAYKIACIFKKRLGDKSNKTSYPRMVDTLLLNIKNK